MTTQTFKRNSAKINCPYLWHSHMDPDSLYPPCIRYNDRIYRNLMLLWAFLLNKDMWDDAFDYILDHADDPLPIFPPQIFPSL